MRAVGEVDPLAHYCVDRRPNVVKGRGARDLVAVPHALAPARAIFCGAKVLVLRKTPFAVRLFVPPRRLKALVGHPAIDGSALHLTDDGREVVVAGHSALSLYVDDSVESRCGAGEVWK